MTLKLPETIFSDRLRLQRLKYEDAEEIFYTYASKSEATRFVAWPTHQSIKETRTFLKFSIFDWDEGYDYVYAIRLKDSNRLVGTINALNENGKVQIGYILSPSIWGMGYATEACRSLVNHLIWLGNIHRIGSFVDVENTASIRVLEKVGFQQEARIEKWFRFINQRNVPKDCILFRYPIEDVRTG